MRPQRVDVEIGALPGQDERDGPVALRTGNPDDLGEGDVGVVVDLLLDLDRVDEEAAQPQRVLQP